VRKQLEEIREERKKAEAPKRDREAAQHRAPKKKRRPKKEEAVL